MLWNFPSAATVLNSVQPQLQTNNQAVFQPQAASVQPVQTTQVTSAQVTAAQVAAAQATSASTTVSQPSISVAALQTAGLSINPAIVRMPLQRFIFLLPYVLFTFDLWVMCFSLLSFYSFSAQISAASLGAQPQFLSSLTSTPIITSAMSNMAGITSQIITNAQGQVGTIKYS